MSILTSPLRPGPSQAAPAAIPFRWKTPPPVLGRQPQPEAQARKHLSPFRAGLRRGLRVGTIGCPGEVVQPGDNGFQSALAHGSL